MKLVDGIAGRGSHSFSSESAIETGRCSGIDSAGRHYLNIEFTAMLVASKEGGTPHGVTARGAPFYEVDDGTPLDLTADGNFVIRGLGTRIRKL